MVFERIRSYILIIMEGTYVFTVNALFKWKRKSKIIEPGANLHAPSSRMQLQPYNSVDCGDEGDVSFFFLSVTSLICRLLAPDGSSRSGISVYNNVVTVFHKWSCHYTLYVMRMHVERIVCNYRHIQGSLHY